ncbi:hypothetical protein D3C80_1707360 [compost metagenome]
MIQRNDFADYTPVTRGIGWASHQKLHESITIGRHIAYLIALTFHSPQHFHRSGWRIKPNAVTKPAIAVRVIGEDQRNAAFFWFLTLQAHPVCRQFRHKSHATGIRLVGDNIGFNRAIELLCRFKRHRT